MCVHVCVFVFFSLAVRRMVIVAVMHSVCVLIGCCAAPSPPHPSLQVEQAGSVVLLASAAARTGQVGKARSQALKRAIPVCSLGGSTCCFAVFAILAGCMWNNRVRRGGSWRPRLAFTLCSFGAFSFFSLTLSSFSR